MKTTAALYARVSSKDQHCEMQLRDLRDYASRQGWKTVEYVEKKSAKEGSERAVLETLLEDARKGRFSIVLVWKMDRFGRSLNDFIQNANALETAGGHLVIPSQGIDTSERNPMAKLQRHFLVILAEFERDLIVERSQAGLDEYRRAYNAGEIGKDRHSKSGKDLPVGRPRAIFDRERARQMRSEGASFRKIAKTMGVGVDTVYRALS